MEYSICPYRESDAERLATIIKAAIQTIGPQAYLPEQVAAWAASHPGADNFRARAASGDKIFVAADMADNAAAYTLLQADGHLDHLYCHPDHTKRGLASLLLKTAEHYARQHDLAQLYTEASELARPTFERAGYRLVQRRDFELDGVPIHNYAMAKSLR
uniref:GNAT family N-acetyltransferase n=1 Tax=Parerythrobacter lutipelagi TaxID=1964208 RepID=UPI0010F9332C|nr:GNAT family N-acetyltransferase [Parerythrobacter lutipelagi]